MSIDPIRLGQLQAVRLKAGKHLTREDGMCAVEACNWLQAREHTDQHASAVIGELMRRWNDGMHSDDERELLKPLVVELAEAGDSLDVSYDAEQRRRLLAADWYCRTCVPTWLELASLTEQAASLRGFRQLLTWDDVAEVAPLLHAAAESLLRAATDAKAAATWSAEAALAARDALDAMDAAGDAIAWDVWDAAPAAAEAAKDAAAKVAWTTASWATWDAAAKATKGAVDCAALESAVKELQKRAVDLVRTMILTKQK